MRVKSKNELKREEEKKEREYVRKVTIDDKEVQSERTLASNEKKIDESLVNCDRISVIKKLKRIFRIITTYPKNHFFHTYDFFPRNRELVGTVHGGDAYNNLYLQRRDSAHDPRLHGGSLER